jgi:hypothetical protein
LSQALIISNLLRIHNQKISQQRFDVGGRGGLLFIYNQNGVGMARPAV